MDAISVTIICGVVTLLISELFRWLNKIRKSRCLQVDIEFK